MAQPIYSTSVQIPYFSGLNQTGDGYNRNMQYAWDMENVNVEGGAFRPMREGLALTQELSKPIGTLAYLHRRYGQNTGTLLVAISNGKVYTKVLDGSDDWVEKYSGLTENDCDFVTYETSIFPFYDSESTYAVNDRCSTETDGVYKSYKCNTAITTPEAWNSSHWTEITVTDPVDILLFTNATDGMMCLFGDTQQVVKVKTPAKFGVLARYNERIWGAGITGDPDKLMYNVPFMPFDWRANTEIPEDGAGDILQPTWDGDSFVALKQYGSTLLAVKRNSIWRIYGTNPGEFTMQQEYGGGTIEENTLCVYNDIAYMLGRNGMMRYDGSGAYPFQQEEIKELMAKVNVSKMDLACAGIRDKTYCLALPINGSEFCNAILEYNALERSIALRTDVSVDSFLQIDERLFYTSATEPGRVFELQDKIGMPLPCKWVSCWQDLGQKNSIKSAFIAYLMVESEAPVELRVGIRTEKKLKQKVIYTKPKKMTRLHLNLQGRQFRLEIESYSTIPFVVAGGIRIDLELDPD